MTARPRATTPALRVSRSTILTVTRRGINPPRPNIPPERELLADGSEWHPSDTPPLTDDEVLALAAVARGDTPPPSPSLDRLIADGYVVATPPLPGLGPDRPASGSERTGASTPPTRDATLSTPSSLTCVPAEDGFAFRGVDGTLVTIDEWQLLVLTELTRPSTIVAAVERVADRLGDRGSVSVEHMDDVAPRLLAAGLLVAEQPSVADATPPADSSISPWESARRLVDQMDHAAAVYRSARVPAGRPAKPAVVPVSHTAQIFDRGWHIVSPNLALGLIFTYCDVYEDGRLHELYDFELQWMPRRRTLKRIVAEHGPSIFLFSNYLWSLSENLAVSAMLKEISPESVTVHGGPSTPKYERDAERFLASHPHVDVLVRGEGERSTAQLLEALGGEPLAGDALAAALADVHGLTFRRADQIVRTPDQERLADLDQIPSPYLEGIFDGYANGAARFVILETNRGCPYGCTFCDWGSATLSRIRKFELERVYEELDWIARNEVSTLLLADANFGIYPRDVEIARRIVELKQEHGYPLAVTICFAKNTAKYLQPIIELFIANDILTEGNLALQTNDAATLETIARKNIKTETYIDVAESFREAGLPLITDLIMGLPGSTVDSFADDLQFCIDNQVTARMVRLEVLVNSPMNEPSYRERHQIVPAVEPAEIEGGKRALVLSTSTYTRGDMGTMLRYRELVNLAENCGLLRHAALWVHHETGLREMDLYRRIDDVARADPERWPLLWWSLRHLVHAAVPPVGWQDFYDELGRFLAEVVGVDEGSGLNCVLAVSRAVAPTLGRQYPCTVVLPHDYATWYHLAFAARSQAPYDWRDRTPHLTDFGPGSLSIDDPNGVCGFIDGSRPIRDGESIDFELRSEVSRSARVRHIELTPAELSAAAAPGR